MLETPSAHISGELLDEHFGKVAPSLLASKMLVAAGDAKDIALQDNYEDLPISLSWSPNGDGLGYFSSTAGWVTVPVKRLARYRVDAVALIASLLSEISDRATPSPLALIPDHLWELGEVRLPARPKRVPIWFARRLQYASDWRNVLQMMRSRPAPGLRILLTSTVANRLPARIENGHAVISVADVLAHGRGMIIDASILAARLDNPFGASSEIVTHSADFRIVTIRGKRHRFTGSKQRQLMRQLVEAYLDGSPKLPTTQVLVNAGYANSINILGKVFSKRSDWREFAEEDDGMCWLVV